MTTQLAKLRDRSEQLERSRSFFRERGIPEVDWPLLSAAASVDVHLHLMRTTEERYLFTSPEYGMKRLLAAGFGDCYQLGHVFRQGERGALHNPEFMMCEWYRVGLSYEAMIAETLEYIRAILGDMRDCCITYRAVFQQYAGLDPFLASVEELEQFAHEKELPIYDDLALEGRDGWLNLIMATYLEAFLGKSGLEVVTEYPASQAMLARKVESDGCLVAERFEVYCQGVELANGYHELADANEQRQRLLEANAQRQRLGSEPLPIDERFLAALEAGLPDCCGVAVGFDRLMMLRHNSTHIDEVRFAGWDDA